MAYCPAALISSDWKKERWLRIIGWIRALPQDCVGSSTTDMNFVQK